MITLDGTPEGALVQNKLLALPPGRVDLASFFVSWLANGLAEFLSSRL